MKNELDLLRGFNRLFGDLSWTQARNAGGPGSDLVMSPACDIEESASQYLMTFDLPGVPKDNIKIEIHDRDLVVSGERKEEIKEDTKSRHVVERYTGSFQRAFVLPTAVNPDQVEASFENGVLRVTVPKKEAVKPKQIKITEGKSNSQKNALHSDKAKQNGSNVRIA